MTMQINKYNNLIVVTRQDLTPGYVAVQSIHAVTVFSNENKEAYQKWYDFSQAITLLAVPNEDHLKFLISKLAQRGIRYSIFNEPDIDNQVTAIAIEPSEAAFKLCSSIPLALRQYNAPALINKHTLNKKEVMS